MDQVREGCGQTEDEHPRLQRRAESRKMRMEDGRGGWVSRVIFSLSILCLVIWRCELCTLCTT